MKKQLAALAALLVLSASVIPAFAGGTAYRSSQRRARAHAQAWNQKMKNTWDKFDAEMDALKKGAGKSAAKAEGEQGSK